MVFWEMSLKLCGILLHGKPWSGIGDYLAEKGDLHMLWDSSVWEVRTTWWGAIVHNSGPVLFPFWYMRDLMILMVLTPVIYWFIKHLRIGCILLLMVVYLLDIRMPWFSDTIVAATLFFSLGAYFSIMKQDFTDVLWRWRYVTITLTIVLIVSQTVTGSNMGDYSSQMVHLWLVLIQTFAFIITARALCRYRRLYKWNRKLAPSSFFIYASHIFILGYVSGIVRKLTPLNDTWYMQCIDYLLTPMVCVAICIAVYAAGRRWMPGVMKVLMGDRR